MTAIIKKEKRIGVVGADEAEGGRLPHGLARVGAEDVGAAEDGGLPGEVAPQGPGAAGAVGVEGRDGVHVAVAGGLGARADGGQDQIPLASEGGRFPCFPS